MLADKSETLPSAGILTLSSYKFCYKNLCSLLLNTATLSCGCKISVQQYIVTTDLRIQFFFRGCFNDDRVLVKLYKLTDYFISLFN